MRFMVHFVALATRDSRDWAGSQYSEVCSKLRLRGVPGGWLARGGPGGSPAMESLPGVSHWESLEGAPQWEFLPGVRQGEALEESRNGVPAGCLA